MPPLHAFAIHSAIGEAVAAVADSLRQITVQIRNGSHSHGSGVIWSSDGAILTNAHVVSTSEPVIELENGRTFTAHVVRRDPRRDLAMLRIDAAGLPVATLAPSKSLEAGTLVLALGHPLGVRGALCLGVLHDAIGVGRSGSPRWIRADVRLAPGNSGGPLADARGRVIGLNTMIVGGLAHAIPSPAVARFALHHERPTLGVTIRPVQLRRRAGAFGFLVLEVLRGSGAEQAGVAIGDVLTAIGGHWFSHPDGLAEALELAQPGERMQVEIMRGFERITRDIVLGTPPAKPRAA